MARDWKQRLLTLFSLTRSHSGLQTLPQMAKSELIVGRQPVPRGGQEMPDNTTARLTRRGAARNPVRTRMPLGPQPCSTVRGSGEQCWLSVCVCERVCESVRACAGSSQGPGPWLTSRARATPAPRSPRSHQPVGEAVPRAGLCAAGVGRVLPRGPGSPLPTSRKPLTVMAKPFVRGSRWCLRLGSPLAWATCMLIWCFFSVKRVPSQ